MSWITKQREDGSSYHTPIVPSQKYVSPPMSIQQVSASPEQLGIKEAYDKGFTDGYAGKYTQIPMNYSEEQEEAYELGVEDGEVKRDDDSDSAEEFGLEEEAGYDWGEDEDEEEFKDRTYNMPATFGYGSVGNEIPRIRLKHDEPIGTAPKILTEDVSVGDKSKPKLDFRKLIEQARRERAESKKPPVPPPGSYLEEEYGDTTGE